MSQSNQQEQEASKLPSPVKALPRIAISFSAAWWLKHYPGVVAARDRNRRLFERFGDVGLGEKNPADPAPCVGGEYGDRFMAAFWGCEIVSLPGLEPAAMILPNAWERMRNLEVPEVETSPIVQNTLRQARILKEREGSCRAEINWGGPLNNAVSVFGSDILFACGAEPELAQSVLRKMGEAILAIHDRLVCKINGVDPQTSRAGGWGIGNCPDD